MTLVGYAQKRRLRIYADPARYVHLPEQAAHVLVLPYPQPLALCPA
jgi:hypothetical protein